MITEPDRHKDEIIALYHELGVKQLDVFGSAVTGTYNPQQSDIDFLVEYPEGYDYGPWGSRHIELKQRLEQLLDRSVDLIILRTLRNPYVIGFIESTRHLLYAASRSLD